MNFVTDHDLNISNRLADDAMLQPTGKQLWYKTILSNEPKNGCIEFVISDGSKTHWDNPSYTSTQKKGRNYLLTISDETTNNKILNNEYKKYTLVNGVLTLIKGPPIMLTTDLDGSLLGHDGYLARFNNLWLQRHIWRGSLLVYSTGRNLKDFLCAASYLNLIQPDFAICGVGTEIYSFNERSSPENTVPSLLDNIEDPNQSVLDPLIQDADLKCPPWCPSRSHATFDPDWLTLMRVEFNRPAVEKLVRSLPGEFYINGNIYHDPWRISVSAKLNDIVELCNLKPNDDRLLDGGIGMGGTLGVKDDHEAGFKHLMNIFEGYKLLLSGRGDFRYLDILPRSAGKLTPLEYLMKKTGFLPEFTVVCGDSGNDVDMFAHPLLRGICVANSQDELKEFLQGKEGLATLRGLKPTPYVLFSTRPCAGAILEGLEYFKFDANLIEN